MTPRTRTLDLALTGALALAVLGGVAGLAGPARERIGQLDDELRERTERTAAWALERVAHRQPTRAEQQVSRARWAELLERVAVIEGEPALIAHVAERLDAARLSRFEVDRQSSGQTGGPAEAAPVATVSAPEGEDLVELVSVPIEVSFRARYEDALAVLERIESRQVPARLESLDIAREPPRVAVKLSLTWWTRLPKAGAR